MQVHSQGSANWCSQEQKRNKTKPPSNVRCAFLHKQPGKVPQTIISVLSANGKEDQEKEKQGNETSLITPTVSDRAQPVPTKKSNFLITRRELSSTHEVHCLSPIVTSGLGFKGKVVHLQVSSPPNGISCDTGGATGENVLDSRENLRPCVPQSPFIKKELNSYPDEE